tara:strand:- start:5285 stop:7189 length:1905 start_codon:yes stop_codon:yes gene_type:complete
MSRYASSKNSPNNFSADKARRTFEQIALDNNEQFGFVIAGDVAETSTTNTQEDASTILEKLAFYSKIRESDVSMVGERNDFKIGNVYNHWSSVLENNRTHYALNTANDTVYLCIRGANNPFWRLDLESKSSFTSTPSDLCTTQYPDDSIWRGLYKINSNQMLSHLGKSLPFRTITDEERSTRYFDTSDPATEAAQICGTGREKVSGTCCLFHKRGHIDAVTGVTFSPGDFFKCDCTKCYKCLDMAKRLDMNYIFNSMGVSGATQDRCLGCDTETFPTNCGACPCTYSQQTDRQKIVDNAKLNPNTSIGTFSKIINECDDVGGQIISMFIDFSNMTKNQLKLKGTGPGLSWPLTITSESGSEAQWEVVGYTEDQGRNWYASGLKKVSEGFNYVNASVTNLNDIFENGFSASRLQVNISPLGGFIENIENIISNVRVQISKSFRSSYLRETLGSDITSLGRVGVVKNVTVDGGRRVLGYGTNANETVDKRLTTKVTATPSTTTASSGKGSKFTLQKGTTVTLQTQTVSSSTKASSYSATQFATSKTNASDSSKVDLELHVTQPETILDTTTITDKTANITYTLDKDSISVPRDNSGGVIDVGSGAFLTTKNVGWNIPPERGTGQSAERSFRVVITL